MRLLINILVLLLISTSAWATTYYVRTDGTTIGSTSTTCNGLYDVAYSTGNGPNCAVNSPLWLLRFQGTTSPSSVFVSGDTMIIGPGEYEIGYGAIGAGSGSPCNATYKADCTWRIPSGIDSAHPTRILGKGYDTLTGTKPQLWGSNNIYDGVIGLYGSDNIEIQYLDITDHATCHNALTISPTPGCSNYARHGIYSELGSNNVLLKNLNIHGLAKSCIMMSGASNWTFTNVICRGNAWSGINADSPRSNDAADSLSGIFTMTGSTIEYSGCVENYPALTIMDNSCTGQGGLDNYYAGYGDAFGTGNGKIGKWVIDKSIWRFNMQDAFDGLHASDPGDSVTITDSLFEGNVGQSVKANAPLTLENSYILDTCGYFQESGYLFVDSAAKAFTYTSLTGTLSGTITGLTSGATGTFIKTYLGKVYLRDITGTFQSGEVIQKDGSNYATITSTAISVGNPTMCRADAAIALGMAAGAIHQIYNSTIFSNSGIIIVGENGSCDANTRITVKNSVILGGKKWKDDTSNPYALAPASNNSANFIYFYNNTPACTEAANFVEDYNNIYGIKYMSQCAGAHDVCTDPTFSGSIKTGPYNVTGYYSTSALSDFSLTATSPAINGGDETITCLGDCSVDYNQYDRGASWDMGAAEYGSVGTCSNGSQDGDETGIDCGGSCVACVVDPTCNDGVQNGDETGVDCGGSCFDCPGDGSFPSTGSYIYNITPIGSIKFQ